MTEVKTVILPDLGEGLTEGQITRILVSVGDQIRRLDPVVEVETDKATSELTSPWEGIVERILVDEGDWIDVGQGVIEISVA